MISHQGESDVTEGPVPISTPYVAVGTREPALLEANGYSKGGITMLVAEKVRIERTHTSHNIRIIQWGEWTPTLKPDSCNDQKKKFLREMQGPLTRMASKCS